MDFLTTLTIVAVCERALSLVAYAAHCSSGGLTGEIRSRSGSDTENGKWSPPYWCGQPGSCDAPLPAEYSLLHNTGFVLGDQKCMQTAVFESLMHKFQQITANASNAIRKIMRAHRRKLQRDFKPLWRKKDTVPKGHVTSSTVKLQMDVSKTIDELLESVETDTKSIFDRVYEMVLINEAALIYRVSDEAKKHLERIVDLQDPQKIADVVLDRETGLLPTMVGYFAKISAQSRLAQGDELSRAHDEIRSVVRRYERSAEQKIISAFSAAGESIFNVTDGASHNDDTGEIGEKMIVKQTMGTLRKLHNVLCFLEEETGQTMCSASQAKTQYRSMLLMRSPSLSSENEHEVPSDD